MLAVRNFSYLDTQLSRVGRNWRQLPINKPVCPFANISTYRDGQMNFEIPKGPNYWPNREGKPHPSTVAEGGLHHAAMKVEGVRGRLRGPKFTNEGDQPYNQATMFYNSMSEVEKEHMVSAAVFELGHCKHRDVQERMMTRFAQIHPEFGKAVSEGFGIAIPEDATKGRTYTDAKSDLSLLSKNNTFTPIGRKVGILALDGCSGSQVRAMMKAYTALGLIVMLVGSRHGPVWADDVAPGDEKAAGELRADFTPESCRSTYFDALFFPGGSETYLKNIQVGRVKHFAIEAFCHYKPIACSGNAVGWLAHECLPGCTDIKADRADTFSEKNGVVLAPNLVGSDSSAWEKLTGASAAASFGKTFLDVIGQHRHWGRDVSKYAY
jgi:catalase